MEYTTEFLEDPFKKSDTDYGVDREKYINEILYNISCDSSHTASSLQELLSLVEELRNYPGIKRIMLSDIDLHIGSEMYALNFNDLEDFIFEGANIIVKDFTSGIAFRNCRNIYLRDINFTYDVPMYASGRTIASTENSVTVELFEPYTTDLFLKDRDNDQKIYNTLFEKELIAEYLEYEPGTNIPREGGNLKYNNYNEGSAGPKLAIAGHTIIDSRRIKVAFNDSINPPPAGTPVSMAFSMYQCPGILFEECENIYLENFEINQVPGMAINFTTTKNININRLQIRSRIEEHQYLTLTADGLHIKNCMGKVKITNSLLEGSHDDALNIAGMYLEVFKVEQNCAWVRAHLGMWATHIPLTGDLLEVRDGSTMAEKGTVTLSEVTEIDDFVKIAFTGTCKLQVGDFLANLNNVASLEFVNNIVRNKRNRGLLLQTRNILVKDNYFSNVIHGAILIVCEVSNFCESISAKNVLIEKNKFYHCNESTAADVEITAMIDDERTPQPPVMEQMLIRNNLMAESGNCSIFINSGRKISIADNIFYKPGRTPLQHIPAAAVTIRNSSEITLSSNNYILHKGSKKIAISNSTEIRQD